jgi:predicted transcriptional regulator
MAIYQLEEELGKVTYNDIAMKLNLTEATVRNFITGLMNKEIPIIKERIFNKKAFFYVKKDFKELNLASRLLELRQLSKNRVTK